MFRHIVTALRTMFRRPVPKPDAGAGVMRELQETAALQAAIAIGKRRRNTKVPADLVALRRWRKVRKRIERDSRRRNRD